MMREPVNLQNKRIILASGSPRRKMLMKGLDIPFEIIAGSQTDESYPAGLPAEDIPVFLARRKAESVEFMLSDHTIVITADTIVVCDGEVIEKPENEAHAREILMKLSGNMHRVLTGVCMRSMKKEKCFTAETKVCFGKLTEEEIRYYVQAYQPFDKAGAYGIQEWIGYVSVERIEGSFYNVMGLPVHQVYQYLKTF